VFEETAFHSAIGRMLLKSRVNLSVLLGVF
jgi:hypothetical protein